MRKWIDETFRTLSVTTVNPVGWGFHRIHSKLRKKREASEYLSLEYLSPVVFVHGIFHNATAFYRFERKLRKEGFLNLSSIELWTTINHLQSMADQLVREVKDLVARVEARSEWPLRARLVAHSLGGMVARVALLDPEFAELIDKVIFLGTPHQGSRLYQYALPPCLRDLAQNSHLAQRLQTDPLPGNIQYFNLRGELDIITAKRATFLPHVPNIAFERVGHAGLLSDTEVVETVVEILESPLYDVRARNGQR